MAKQRQKRDEPQFENLKGGRSKHAEKLVSDRYEIETVKKRKLIYKIIGFDIDKQLTYSTDDGKTFKSSKFIVLDDDKHVMEVGAGFASAKKLKIKDIDKMLDTFNDEIINKEKRTWKTTETKK